MVRRKSNHVPNNIKSSVFNFECIHHSLYFILDAKIAWLNVFLPGTSTSDRCPGVVKRGFSIRPYGRPALTFARTSDFRAARQPMRGRAHG
jgi:hypothetical protein